MQRIKVFLAIILAGVTWLPGDALAAQKLPMDQPFRINSVDSVCTGESLDMRADARWNDYALKIEFAGPGGQYVGGETVNIAQNGKDLLNVTCAGPWLLLQLPPGRYDVTATLGGQQARSAAFVSKHGQGHIILRFTGEVASLPPPKP